MSDLKEGLIERIEKLKVFKTGDFTLASGAKSNFYIDLQVPWKEYDDISFEVTFKNTENSALEYGLIWNENLIENLGFNVNLRWNDEYLWESTFADAIIEAKTVVDAQVNYTVDKWKSVFKVGAANLGGKEYFSAPGTGIIGSQYFVSWTINP